MTKLELFTALRSDDTARIARIVEAWERHQMAMIHDVAPTPYDCAVCHEPIRDLHFLAFGGRTVAHRGLCSLQYELRMEQALQGVAFDLRKWVNES